MLGWTFMLMGMSLDWLLRINLNATQMSQPLSVCKLVYDY